MTNQPLNLFFDFKNHEPGEQLQWFCPPKQCYRDEERQGLRVRTLGETDFWQRTHYGFRVDNGHFLFTELEGNFTITTKVHTLPVHRYDQAGLMIRLSSDCWLKTSVEYIPDGPNKLGAVVTNRGYSDWSTQDLDDDQSILYFRIIRKNSDYHVEYSIDGNAWIRIRTAHLHEDTGTQTVMAGLYACSPQGEGYEAQFEFLHIIDA